MSVFFATLNPLSFKDCLPQPNGKGRISRFSSISRQLFKSHYDGYHPRTARQLATALKRYINTRPKYERRSPEFVAEMRRKIICLHEYNQQIAKVKFKYPRSEHFNAVLIQYIELESGLLYDTSKEVDEKHENDVTQRVLRLLRVIVYDSLQSSDVSQKSTIEACDKILLKLFASVRDDFDPEVNKVVSNTIQKLLQKLKLLNEVNKLKGKNVSFQQDTYLKDPLVSAIRQNLATSDYESEIDGYDDDDLATFSSVDQTLNFTHSKNFDDLLSNHILGINSFITPYSSREVEKEFSNAIDQSRHNIDNGESSRNFVKTSELNQNGNTSGTNFKEEQHINTPLALRNLDPPNKELHKTDYISFGNILKAENRRNTNHFLSTETSTQELTKRSPYSKNGENKTFLKEQKRNQLGYELNQKSLKTTETFSNMAQNEEKSSDTNSFKDSSLTKAAKFSKDKNFNSLDADKIEVIEDCGQTEIFPVRTNRKSVKSEVERVRESTPNNAETAIVDLDDLPDNSISCKKSQTNRMNGGIVIIEILDDDNEDGNSNVYEESSQSPSNLFSTLLQSNEIKQEENEENRSPNFPVRNADNNEPNLLNSDKNSRNSNSGEFGSMEKNSKDAPSETDSILISDSEDEIVNTSEIPTKTSCKQSSEISKNTTSEDEIHPVETSPIQSEIYKDISVEDNIRPLEASSQVEKITECATEQAVLLETDSYAQSSVESEILVTTTSTESPLNIELNQEETSEVESSSLNFDNQNQTDCQSTEDCFQGIKTPVNETAVVPEENEYHVTDVTCKLPSQEIQAPTTEISLCHDVEQKLSVESQELDSMETASVGSDMSLCEEMISSEIEEGYHYSNFAVQSVDLQNVPNESVSEKIFASSAEHNEIEISTQNELDEEEILECTTNCLSESVVEDVEQIQTEEVVVETREDETQKASIPTDIENSKESNSLRDELEVEKEITECSTTHHDPSFDSPQDALAEVVVRIASPCHEQTVSATAEIVEEIACNEEIESNTPKLVPESMKETVFVGDSVTSEEQPEDSVPRNVECVPSVIDQAIDYSLPQIHPVSSPVTCHNEEKAEENQLNQHNEPLPNSEPNVITTHISESILVETPKHEATTVSESMPLYTVPSTTPEVQYDDFSGEKKAAGLEMLAELAVDRLEVKTDNSQVDTANSHTKDAETTPKLRKSKIREVLPRAVKQAQKRSSRKQKVNVDQQNKIVTRNMRIKLKTDAAISKKKVTANADSNYKPHDFISIENSTLPPRTNNVYAQKRFMETNTTSEDSNDSCESILFIHLEESQIEKSKSVFEEETISDMLEFISTKENEICISIPEVVEENCSNSFHILKQMEDFVDNNNQKSVQEAKTDDSWNETQPKVKTDESINTEKDIPTFEDFVSKFAADDTKNVKTTDHSIDNILNKTALNGEKIVTTALLVETELQDSTSKLDVVQNEKLEPSKTLEVSAENEKQVHELVFDLTKTLLLSDLEEDQVSVKNIEIVENKNIKEKQHETSPIHQLVEAGESIQPEINGEENCEKIFKTKAAMKLYEDRLQPNQFVLRKFKNSVATQELGIRTRLRSKSSEQVKKHRLVLENRSRSASVDFKIGNDSHLKADTDLSQVSNSDVDSEPVVIEEGSNVSEAVTCAPIPSIIIHSPTPAEESQIEEEINKREDIAGEVINSVDDLQENKEKKEAEGVENSTSSKLETSSSSTVLDIAEVTVSCPDSQEVTKEQEIVEENPPLLQKEEVFDGKDVQSTKHLEKEKNSKSSKTPDGGKGRSLENSIKKMKEKIKESEQAKKEDKTEDPEETKKDHFELETPNVSENISQSRSAMSDEVQHSLESNDSEKNGSEESESKKNLTEQNVDMVSEQVQEMPAELIPDEFSTTSSKQAKQKSIELSSGETKKTCISSKGDTKKILSNVTIPEEIKPKSSETNKDDIKKPRRSPEESKPKDTESSSGVTKKDRSRSSSISRTLDKKSTSSTDKEKSVHKSSRSRSSSKSRSSSDKKSKHYSDSEADRKRRSASKCSGDKVKVARSQEDGHTKIRSKSPCNNKSSSGEKNKRSSAEKSSSKHKSSDSKVKSTHDEKKDHRKRSSKSPPKAKSNEVKEKQLPSEKKKTGDKEKTKTKSEEVQNKCQLTSLENISKINESSSPKVEHKSKTKSKLDDTEAKIDQQIEENVKEKHSESQKTKSSNSVKTSEKDKHRDGHRNKAKEKKESKSSPEKEKPNDAQKKDDHSKSVDKSRRSHSKEKTRLESSSRSGKRDRSSKDKHKENRTTEHSRENNKCKEKAKEDGKSVVEKFKQKSSRSKKSEIIVGIVVPQKREKIVTDSEVKINNSEEFPVKKKGEEKTDTEIISPSLEEEITKKNEVVIDSEKRRSNSDEVLTNKTDVDMTIECETECNTVGYKKVDVVAEPHVPKQTDDLQVRKLEVPHRRRKLDFGNTTEELKENQVLDETPPAKVVKIDDERLTKDKDSFVKSEIFTAITATRIEVGADKVVLGNDACSKSVTQTIPETSFASKEEVMGTQDMTFNRFTSGSEHTIEVQPMEENKSLEDNDKATSSKTQEVIEVSKETIVGKENDQSVDMELCESGMSQSTSTEEDINNKTEITTPVKLLLQNAIEESIPSARSVYNDTVLSSSQNIGVQVLATLVDSHVQHLPVQEADLSLLPIMSTSITTDATTSTASLSCTVTSVAGDMVSSCSVTSVQEKCLFTYQDSEAVNRENLNTSEMFHSQLGLDVISPNKLPLASNQSLDFISPSTSMAEISKPMNLVHPLGTSSINFEVTENGEIDMQQSNKQSTFCSNYVTRVTGISCYVEKESTADHNYTLGDPLLGGNNKEDKNILTTDFLSNSPEEFSINSSHLEDNSFNDTNLFEENSTLEELGLLAMECKKENTAIIDDQIPKPEDLRNSLKHLNMLMENSQTNEPKTMTVDNAIDPTSITDSCNYAVSKVLFLRGGQETAPNTSFPIIPDIENIIDTSFPPLGQEKQPENSHNIDESNELTPIRSTYSSFMSSENQKVVVVPVEQYPITSIDELKEDYITKSDEKSKPTVNNKPINEVKTSTFRPSSILELVKKEASKNDSQKVKDEMEMHIKRRHHRTPVNPPKKKDVTQQQQTKSPSETKKNESLLFNSTNSTPVLPGGRIRVKTDLLKVTDSKCNLTDSLSSLEYINEHDQNVASEVILPFSKPSPLGHKTDIPEKKPPVEPISKGESTKSARFDKQGNDIIMETILNVHSDGIQKSPKVEANNSEKHPAKKPNAIDSTKKRKVNDNEVKQEPKRSKKSDDEEEGRKTSDKKPSNDDIFDQLLREGPVNKVFAQKMAEQTVKKENHVKTNPQGKNRGSLILAELHKKERQLQPHSKSVHVHKDGVYQKNPAYFTSSSNSHQNRKNSDRKQIPVPDDPQKRFIRNYGNSYNSKSEPSTTRDSKSRDRRMSSDQLNNISRHSSRLQGCQEDDKFSWLDKFEKITGTTFESAKDLFKPAGNEREDTSS